MLKVCADLKQRNLQKMKLSHTLLHNLKKKKSLKMLFIGLELSDSKSCSSTTGELCRSFLRSRKTFKRMLSNIHEVVLQVSKNFT